jgi:hypothetical protein
VICGNRRNSIRHDLTVNSELLDVNVEIQGIGPASFHRRLQLNAPDLPQQQPAAVQAAFSFRSPA